MFHDIKIEIHLQRSLLYKKISFNGFKHRSYLHTRTQILLKQQGKSPQNFNCKFLKQTASPYLINNHANKMCEQVVVKVYTQFNLSFRRRSASRHGCFIRYPLDTSPGGAQGGSGRSEDNKYVSLFLT